MNTNIEELQNLFDITQKLILEHEAEILNVSPIDWTASSWTRSTLTHNQVIKWIQSKGTRLTKAKVHVYSDSVLCLGKVQKHSETNSRWKINSKFFDSPICTENYLELMKNR